jgi:hypothetical protein
MAARLLRSFAYSLREALSLTEEPLQTRIR